MASLKERVHQKLKLQCSQCGHAAVYDVGRVVCQPKETGTSGTTGFAFTGYFRCQECGGGGPWEMVDYLKLTALTLRAALGGKNQGVIAGEFQLFDGTKVQTPALAEDHLRALIEKEPANAFLHSRLGNVFRGCHQPARAIPCYEHALLLDPGDVEARYHLFDFALERGDVPALLTHGPLMVRHLLAGRRTKTDDLTENIAFFVVENLRDAPAPFREQFLGSLEATTTDPAGLFIRSLLEQEGDEEDILADATERLLRGQALPTVSVQTTAIAPKVESAEPELMWSSSARASKTWRGDVEVMDCLLLSAELCPRE